MNEGNGGEEDFRAFPQFQICYYTTGSGRGKGSKSKGGSRVREFFPLKLLKYGFNIIVDARYIYFIDIHAIIYSSLNLMFFIVKVHGGK